MLMVFIVFDTIKRFSNTKKTIQKINCHGNWLKNAKFVYLYEYLAFVAY